MEGGVSMSLMTYWLARYRGVVVGLFVGLAAGGAFLKQTEPMWGRPQAVSLMLTMWGVIGLVWVLGFRRWLARSIPAEGVSRAGAYVAFGDSLFVMRGLVVSLVGNMYQP